MVGGRVVVGLVSLLGGPHPLFKVHDDLLSSPACTIVIILLSYDDDHKYWIELLSEPLSKPLS